jgi:hypothetical protein
MNAALFPDAWILPTSTGHRLHEGWIVVGSPALTVMTVGVKTPISVLPLTNKSQNNSMY